MVSGDFADIDAFGVGPGVAEQGVAGEIIVDDHVGFLEYVLALDGQQAGVAGAGADEINFHAILVRSVAGEAAPVPGKALATRYRQSPLEERAFCPIQWPE